MIYMTKIVNPQITISSQTPGQYPEMLYSQSLTNKTGRNPLDAFMYHVGENKGDDADII